MTERTTPLKRIIRIIDFILRHGEVFAFLFVAILALASSAREPTAMTWGIFGTAGFLAGVAAIAGYLQDAQKKER